MLPSAVEAQEPILKEDFHGKQLSQTGAKFVIDSMTSFARLCLAKLLLSNQPIGPEQTFFEARIDLFAVFCARSNLNFVNLL